MTASGPVPKHQLFMSSPSPKRRIVPYDRQSLPAGDGAIPGRIPEALLRIGADGICLEVMSFDEFDSLPPPSTLRGAHVRHVLPREVGTLVSSYVSQAPMRVQVQEVVSGGRCFLVEMRPNRDGTVWVRLKDVTHIGRAAVEPDSRAATLSAVSRAARDATSVEDLTRRTLSAMCEALNWEIGLFWEVDSAADVIRCRQTVAAAGVRLQQVDSNGAASTLGRGQGLAGRVWAAGYADTAFGGFHAHPVFAGTPLADELWSGFAFPIRGVTGLLGVVELASRAVEVAGAELLRTAAIVSHHVSQCADRLRAEQAMRESDAQKAAILSNALDGIITMDGDARIVELNAEAERTFGFGHGAMLGRDLAEFTVGPKERVKLCTELTVLAGCKADGKTMGRRLQVRAVRADGEEFPADLSITRIPLDGPPHFTVCIRDLSEQERLQGALHHAQKMESLGLLASGIAHDFNNFLTVIRGQAERLIKNLAEEDTRRRWVMSILKVSERASALTGQLLAFGRREASTAAIVDLNAIVESTAGLLSQQLGDGITWQAALSPSAGRARVGEGQVQQILFNLVLNARDAMPEVGTLQVGTKRVDLADTEARQLLLSPGPYVLLWVKDSGRGMDARTRSRVFEPFFTTKKLGEGTGLGLSTVYALVQQSGGQIWFAPKNRPAPPAAGRAATK